MAGRFTIYGAKGSGSVPVEAAMTLLGLPYDVVEAATWEGPEQQAKVEKINPLKQIPALVWPGGEVMTESAAMLIALADLHPDSHLSPGPLERRRAQFLRWMVYVPASIYSLFWIRDDPSRMADDPAVQADIKRRTAERIAECWRIMDEQLRPSGPYLLGGEMSVLDLYVTVVSRWGPRRKRFYEVAPRMADIVRRVDADPRLSDLWSRRFPFEEGWEG
jgi:GST-like protein